MTKRRTVEMLVVLVAIAVVIAFEWAPSRMSVAEDYIPELNRRQEKAIDIYVATTQQLMTLATLVIAAAGASGFRRAEKRMPAAIAAGMAGFSIYFGYASMSATVWMLNSGFFNLDAPVIDYARQLQFWLFLVSASVVSAMWLTMRRTDDRHVPAGLQPSRDATNA